MKKYIMGVDVGTTGTKAIIFDMTGNIVGKAYTEYKCVYPHPNWVEQDAEMLGRATVEVCSKAVSNASVSADDIASLSVSAQRCCLIMMDENDNCLKMISWMDNRAGDELPQIQEKTGADDFYRISGLPLGTTWILPKLLWVRKNEPELWSRTRKIVQLHDYILKALGADDYYSDESDSGFWGFWDTDNLCWHEGMLKEYDINAEMLPKICKSGTRVGETSHDLADGTFGGIPLCVGAGDQNCAAVGAGVVKDGRASVSLGTGGLAMVFVSKPFRDSNGKIIVTNSAVHGCWQIEGLQNGAAGVYRWFRDEIGALEKKTAEENGGDPYVLLNEMIEKSPVGAKGLLFMPYLASAASPRYNDKARGCLLGLTFSHTRGDMARAVLEGISMEQLDILTSIRATGVNLTAIRIMGGATNSKTWNQIQADMYGCRVETLRVKDAAVLGAAICGAVGVGCFESIEEAVEVLVQTESVYEPIPEHTEMYQKLYSVYCHTYEALDNGGVYTEICGIQ